MKKYIEIKYKDLIDGSMKTALDQISNSIEFPVLFSFKVAKIGKFIDECIEDIKIFQNKLLKKYGKFEGENLVINKGTEEYIKYTDELSKFLDEKIVCNIEKISLLEIKDYKILPSTIKKIIKLIAED
jgi:hypothetical protein